MFSSYDIGTLQAHVTIYCVTRDGDFLNLADVNECSEVFHRCHENANCSNTDGSYECHCSAGYTGDGTVCEGTVRL